MTSSNGNIFRVAGPLYGEFTGPRWIPPTKASDTELWCFLWSAPELYGWVNNDVAGDLRRHWAHYDVIIMDMRITKIRFVTVIIMIMEIPVPGKTTFILKHAPVSWETQMYIAFKFGETLVSVNRGNTKASHYLCVMKGITGDRWIPFTKGQ